MLVKVEYSKYQYSGNNQVAYIFDAQSWKTRQLRALSFIKADREAKESFVMMSIFGGLFSMFPGVGTLVAWAEPGYVPATIWAAVGTAGMLGATVPYFARKTRAPRHERARGSASNRSHAILLTHYSDGAWRSDAYSMQALLKTDIGKTLEAMFKSDAATNRQEILAQLSADGTEDTLFLKFKPTLDEYFRSTVEMDIELATARAKEEGSKPQAEIAKNEKEIDAYAAEVAEELAGIVKVHEESLQMQARTSLEMASDNLRLARDAFRMQRGNYMPED